MPPWIPGQRQPSIIGQRWLSDGELKLIVQWVEDGCAFGNEADLPPTAKYADGWQLGSTDLVVKMQERLRSSRWSGLLQNFVLPIKIPEDKTGSCC